MGPPAQTPRPRVMVIDDEPRIGRVLERVLRREFDGAVDVHTFERAKPALDLLLGDGEHASLPFDVIFCDLMMPEMNGIEFHAELVLRAPTLVSRVVFLTGAGLVTPLAELVDQWANEWLPKPLDLTRLRAIVRERISYRLVQP